MSEADERDHAATHAVIHKSAPEAVDSMLARLRRDGIDAIAIDEPNFIMRLVAFGTYRVRIAVPSDQEQRAKDALAAWDRDASGTLRELTSSLRPQFLASLGVAVVVGAVVFLVSGWEGLPLAAAAFPAAFLLTFLALSALQRRRH